MKEESLWETQKAIRLLGAGDADLIFVLFISTRAVQ